ncbi:MAG: type II toxin-antitoxin system RelE/ParE family toxin [Methanolinea sp.]|jgi:mRNA interferase RelE/StbE|nr:type II toxin-antitoxin system RelE/ParE family toxin [Methanolinea sp.]
MFQVWVSKTFQREFHKIPADSQTRIRKSLTCLERDPYISRAHADIKPLKDTHPQKYRMRVGDYRVVYVIEGNDVRILDIFHRRQGYSGQ